MSDQERMHNEVKLWVGSSGESVYVLRTVAASLAARLDFSLDEIDDLTLAVSEAAACLLAEGKRSSRLSMRAGVSGQGIEAVLAIDATGVEWPPPNLESGLAWKILSALADRAEFVMENQGPGIRLVKNSSSPRAVQ